MPVDESDKTSYTISFDINDPANSNYPFENLEGRSGDIITVPSIGEYTKENHVFYGWNTRDDGRGTFYSQGSDLIIPQYDITLYAIWKSNQYSVIFDKNSPDATGHMDSLKLYMNTSVALSDNNFVNEGYVFVGWSLTEDGTGSSYYDGATINMESSDLTLYAQWAVNYCNILFDNNSSDVTGSMNSLKVDKLSSGILPLNSLTYDGYKFLGWNTAADGSESSYSDGSKIIVESTDITLYAQWGHSITFDKNSEDATGVINGILCIESSDVTIPSNPFSNEHATFLGWNTAPDGSGFSYVEGDIFTMDSSDITFYAQWAEYVLTEGFITYTLNNNGYKVSACDSSATGVIIIPDEISSFKITSIGDEAFSNCSNITSLTIPETVTDIGYGAFEFCVCLTSVNLPAELAEIEDALFYGCTSLTSITIPDGVTLIGNSAFNDCTSLTSITLPESITAIEHYSFSDCSSLTSIMIPEGVITIGTYSFYGCTSLTSITIPEGVTAIKNYSFYGCTSLTSITIPEGVTTIGSSSFRDCSSLSSISIPASVTHIDNYAFRNCDSLNSISIYAITAPSTGHYPFSGIYNITLHIKAETTGYDMMPWDSNYIFPSVVRDL